MLSARPILRQPGTGEGEKPFWISYADLMTALMVLFLVVMVISLLSVTQQLRQVKQKDVQREQEIEKILDQLGLEAQKFSGISVSKERWTIDFGEKARFAVSDYRLSGDATRLLREFVPSIIKVARSDLGQRWIKRVLVEGFTDPRGSYLFNLDLSLKRAHSVVCGLLAPVPGVADLSADEVRAIQSLFLVGGFSFNGTRVSNDESRRVELRLEFRMLDEVLTSVLPADVPVLIDTGRCQLT
jgi:flagellar motor protein MotB